MIETVLEDVAHGGWTVARIDGKVMFVAGGLPGERVRVERTDEGRRFDRGRVVAVLEPHAERVEPPCPVAGVCGGCDWQHASVPFQRELKRRVVAEQLHHLAGIEWDGVVQEVGPTWGWRTRMRYVAEDGRLGLRGRRSHDVVPLPDEGCRIAGVQPPALPAGVRELEVVDAASGRSVLADGDLVEGRGGVGERAAGREYLVDADGFWQVHPAAADTLVTAVRRALAPADGERAVDLYCGVGLFAGALADDGLEVWGVEVSRAAVEHARENVPGARFDVGRVERVLRRRHRRADVVVLDPPRKGAGREGVEAVARMRPRAVAHVACDPSALGRDLALFREQGYVTTAIEAFDLFPQTHHIECVATLRRK